MNPRIENWAVVHGEADPYTPPELITQHIHGQVYGHPKFPDGCNITTSSIQAVETDRTKITVVTKSGSRYELGEVLPHYEATFPNARQRLIDSAKAKS